MLLHLQWGNMRRSSQPSFSHPDPWGTGCQSCLSLWTLPAEVRSIACWFSQSCWLHPSSRSEERMTEKMNRWHVLEEDCLVVLEGDHGRRGSPIQMQLLTHCHCNWSSPSPVMTSKQLWRHRDGNIMLGLPPLGLVKGLYHWPRSLHSSVS